MPSPNSAVALLPLPATAGATDAEFVDPTTRDLIAFVAHWLTWGLDAKTATMTTPPVPSTIPLANQYTSGPSSVYLARKLPALFVYWNGKSQSQLYSTIRTMRMREFQLLYTYERVRYVEGVQQWSGLISTVDALMHRAFSKRSHPTFAANGYAAGSDLSRMCGWLGVEYMGGREDFLQEIVQKSMRDVSTAAGRASANKAQGGIQMGYPSFAGTVRVWEEVFDDTLLDPQDVTSDLLVHMAVTEGSADPAVPDVLDRYLTPPDGSVEGAEDP